MKTFSNNKILQLSFEFALAIIEYAEKLESQKKYVLSRQVLAAGTSIGANLMESQEAESRADFIHKLKVASKEVMETEYWLQLCNYSNTYPDSTYLINKITEIKKILWSIIATNKRQVKS